MALAETQKGASNRATTSCRLDFRVVMVGASAAAPEATLALFESMPPNTGMAFVLLQEDASQCDLLSPRILSSNTALGVREAESGAPLQPDLVHVVGPGHRALMRGGALHLTISAGTSAGGTLIDEGFRSLARDQGEGATSILLGTVAGSGLEGARAIKEAGGRVLAQEPSSAVYPNGPRGLIEGGWADFIARPEDMPEILLGLSFRETAVPGERPGRPAGESSAGQRGNAAGVTEDLMPARLGREDARYRTMVEGVEHCAMFMTDACGRVGVWPAGAQRLLGTAEQDALNRPLDELLKVSGGGAVAAGSLIAEVQRRGVCSLDGWYERADGSQFWGGGMLSAARGTHHGIEGFIGVLRDATAEKRAEEALHQAKAAAEAANQAKDHFLATVSHELRTPLAAMLLWSKLLDDERIADPERLREGLEAIRKCAEEQQELIEDLLDTSRIVSGRLRLEIKATDLASVLRAAAEAIRPAAEAKGLRTDVLIDAQIGSVEADHHRVKQMIWNLLSNAVKFTPPGGKIILEARRLESDVAIRVEDTGPGIPPQRLPHVFDRFWQTANATSRVTGGLGLGLSITKQLVELHGGTIAVQSGAGRGCVFTVRLPLPACSVDALPAARRCSGSLPPGLQGCHLYLVEDSPDTRRALQAALAEAGAEVSAFADAPSALEGYLRRRPELLLSDIGLPDVDGHAFIRQVRSLERFHQFPAVPAVALTAFADEQNCRQALENGFQKCLTKPIDPARLIEALARLRP